MLGVKFAPGGWQVQGPTQPWTSGHAHHPPTQGLHSPASGLPGRCRTRQGYGSCWCPDLPSSQTCPQRPREIRRPISQPRKHSSRPDRWDRMEAGLKLPEPQPPPTRETRMAPTPGRVRPPQPQPLCCGCHALADQPASLPLPASPLPSAPSPLVRARPLVLPATRMALGSHLPASPAAHLSFPRSEGARVVGVLGHLVATRSCGLVSGGSFPLCGLRPGGRGVVASIG